MPYRVIKVENGIHRLVESPPFEQMQKDTHLLHQLWYLQKLMMNRD